MKKKNSTQTSNAFLIFLIVLISLFLFYNTILKNVITPSTVIQPSPKTVSEKEYQSSFLKIHFRYPADFQVKESGNSIFLENKRRYIHIGTIGSNYSTLDEHLNGLEEMNKVQIVDRLNIQINDLKSINAVIKNPQSGNPDTYIYFFYPKEWTVISISTDSKDLKADLDKIAQSFQYNP